VRCRRAYYYCRRCGQGFFPFDQQAGVTTRRLTPAAERLATLAGAVGDSFEKGAELLAEMAAIRLSEATLQRATRDAGRRTEASLGQGYTFGPRVRWEWRRDARGRPVAYFTIDATGTRPQAKGGGKAEGRLAYVAGVYNPPPAEWLLPPGQAPPAVQAR
jgi:hypothetical protein